MEEYEDSFPTKHSILDNAGVGIMADIHQEVLDLIIDPWVKKRLPPNPNRPRYWTPRLQRVHNQLSRWYRKWRRTNDPYFRRRHRELGKHARWLRNVTKQEFDEQTARLLLRSNKSILAKAAKRDLQIRKQETAGAVRSGRQLLPADFTRKIGDNQGVREAIYAERFDVPARFQTSLHEALIRMDNGKAVGSDDLHI